MYTGMMAALTGICMGLLGWLCFRRPGVRFWMWLAPVWQANRYLNPIGATLWIAGCVVGCAGVILMLINAW
jgi:hypothetical protein